MAITNDGVSDSYEFELPIVDSDVLVTNVDIANGKIHLAAGDVVDAGDYEVGDVYDGNLGTLVGRRVNVGVNSDNEIERLSVKKANVVTGVMKYVDKGDDDAIDDKDYFEDQVTKTKYYMTTSGTSTINVSQAICVATGDRMWDLDWYGDNETTYNYAKLVLNSNGTVSCAVINPFAWNEGTIKVADVDGTIVSETSKVNVDLDGYTIVKDDEYITAADLEEDDVIFYSSAKYLGDDVKFAEVYTDVVEGEPSDIDSTSIAIDGTSYKWAYGDPVEYAKYYNTDDDVYDPLIKLGGSVDAQKYLSSLDPDLGVTAYLDRLGQIAYIDGVVSGTAVTTDTWYVTTSAGTGYTQALGSYLKFKVSDGTEQTIEIPTSQLKKFNGVKIKEFTGADGTDTAKGTDYKFTLVAADGEKDVPAYFGGAKYVQAKNLVEEGVLVKLTRDEDGKVIGITFGGEYGTANGAAVDVADTYAEVDKIDGKDSNALKPGVEKVEIPDDDPSALKGTKAKLTDNTVIWVFSTKGDKKTVTKQTFEDYTRTTDKVAALNAANVGPYVQVTGSSVTDVLLRETITNDVSDTFVDGATSEVEGIVTGFKTKKNADGDKDYVYSVTILDNNGNKVSYDSLDESLATPIKGNYVALAIDKETGDITEISDNYWTKISVVAAATSTSTEIGTIDNDTIKLDSSAGVFKKSGSTYTAIKLNQIAASTNFMTVSWHDQYYNNEKNEDYADFVVVQEYDTLADAVAAADEANANALTLTPSLDTATNKYMFTFNKKPLTGTLTATSSDLTIATVAASAADGEVTATHVADGGTTVVTIAYDDGDWDKTWVYTLKTSDDTFSECKDVTTAYTAAKDEIDDLDFTGLAFSNNKAAVDATDIEALATVVVDDADATVTATNLVTAGALTAAGGTITADITVAKDNYEKTFTAVEIANPPTAAYTAAKTGLDKLTAANLSPSATVDVTGTGLAVEAQDVEDAVKAQLVDQAKAVDATNLASLTAANITLTKTSPADGTAVDSAGTAITYNATFALDGYTKTVKAVVVTVADDD